MGFLMRVLLWGVIVEVIMYLPKFLDLVLTKLK